MDPVTLLERLRELARQVLAPPADPDAGYTDAEADTRELAAVDLAAGLQDLDEWRNKGGFDPWDREYQLRQIAEREERDRRQSRGE